MKMKNISFYLFIIIFITGVLGANGDEDFIPKLREKLLANYDPGSRPVKDHQHWTNVTLGLALRQLHIDDKQQILKFQAWLILNWDDEYLNWNETDFGGLDIIHVSQNEIWKPDFKVYNSISEEIMEVPILVYSTGKVMWIPSLTSEVFCNIDLTDWPNDQHECIVQFGSWTHHGEQINLQPFETADVLDDYKRNSRWEIINNKFTKKEIKYDKDIYAYMELHLNIKRTSESQYNFIRVSSLGVVLMILSSYMVPFKNPIIRLMLHFVSIVVSALYGTILYSALPVHEGQMPKIARYFTGQLLLCILSLIGQICFITCFNADENIIISLDPTSPVSIKLSKIASKIPGVKKYARRQMEETNLRYHTIDEEIIGEPIPFPETPVAPLPSKESVPAKTVSRIVNFILFFMFALAFIVDHVAMNNSMK